MDKKVFTKIDEEFICDNCGRKVPKLGYTSRDHCPYCLHSKHVDKNPGDREEECHGDLVPIRMEPNSKKGYVIIYKCKKCNEIIDTVKKGNKFEGKDFTSGNLNRTI